MSQSYNVSAIFVSTDAADFVNASDFTVVNATENDEQVRLTSTPSGYFDELIPETEGEDPWLSGTIEEPVTSITMAPETGDEATFWYWLTSWYGGTSVSKSLSMTKTPTHPTLYFGFFEEVPEGEGEGEGTPDGEGEGEGTPDGEGEGEGEGIQWWSEGAWEGEGLFEWEGELACEGETGTAMYELTLTTSGYGAIHPDPGIYHAQHGTPILVSATPMPGWRFDAWSAPVRTRNAGDPDGTVMVCADTAAVAAFLPDGPADGCGTFSNPWHEVQLGADDGGNVGWGWSVFPEETIVYIEALPIEGYCFVRWTGDTPADAADASTTLEVDGPKYLRAEFAQAFRVYDAQVSGGGTVACNLEYGKTYPRGTQVTFTATPEEGWEFDTWSCVGLDSASDTLLSGGVHLLSRTLAAYTRPTIEFAQTPHSVNITIDPPEAGSVMIWPQSGMATEGQTVALMAYPNDDFTFNRWVSGSGINFTEIENGVSSSFVMPDHDCDITAEFAPFSFSRELGYMEDMCGVSLDRHREIIDGAKYMRIDVIGNDDIMAYTNPHQYVTTDWVTEELHSINNECISHDDDQWFYDYFPNYCDEYDWWGYTRSCYCYFPPDEGGMYLQLRSISSGGNIENTSANIIGSEWTILTVYSYVDYLVEYDQYGRPKRRGISGTGQSEDSATAYIPEFRPIFIH